MSSQQISEPQLLAAVLRFQETGSERDAEAALKLADPLIHGMTARAITVYRVDPRSSYNRVLYKVFRSLKTFRPDRGRCFSYLNTTVQNCVRTLCNEQLRDNEREVSLEQLEAENWQEPFGDEFLSRWKLEDIHHRLRCLRTICTRSNELKAQRWLVNSLIKSEFTIPRHQAVRALQIVHAVDLKQGRLIFDRTLLELRRTMLAGRERFPEINISVLKDKRERGLLKFKPFLSQPNFDKLIYLMRGLAPAIIDERIAQGIRSLNGTRSPETEREVIRQNLRYALEGYPDARPLFANGSTLG
jgi:hypothetical protein